ncbi:MAG TPA: hypothetical protein VE174_04645 [Actinomycetota bacterium]|nr:hypothetical protein [Actinomycetota bacterium]
MIIPSESMKAAMKNDPGGIGPRPWTVPALLIVLLAGTIVGLVDDRLSWGGLVGLAVNGLLMFGLWKGKGWVYTLLFAVEALVVVMLLIVFVWIRPPGQAVPVETLVVGGLVLILLMHPATRRYAGTDRARRETKPAESTPKML